MRGIDVSNHNNLALSIQQARGKGHDPELIIVRGSLENADFIAIAHDQCRETQNRGLKLDIYGWCYATADDPAEFVDRLVEEYGDYKPYRWWLDCEEDMRPGAFKSWHPNNVAANIAWLTNVVSAFDDLGLLDKVGIYTGHWFWAGQWFENATDFAYLPLWNATDTKVPDRSRGWEYGGWTKPWAGVQFDLSGPDLDEMDPALYADAPANPETANPPDDIADRLSRLGGLEHDVMPAWLAELNAALEPRAAWKGHVETVRDQLAHHLGVDKPE